MLRPDSIFLKTKERAIMIVGGLCPADNPALGSSSVTRRPS